MSYVAPLVIIFALLYGFCKRVNVYDGFVQGARGAVNLSVGILPYLVATFMLVNALRASGLDSWLVKIISPPFNLLGVPSELVQLMLLRPFTGSGSLAVLTDVYSTYGVDSYVGRSASVIMGCGETVFYVASVYFAQTKVKRTGWVVPIALFCNFVGGVLACMLCKVM